MKFRNDIQEIRAIAILLVLFYHLSSKYVQGGYIGVDIFFVISGYLISNILLSNRNEKRITHVFNFYGKRIKRLFPSSFICLVCYYYYHPTLSKQSIYENQLYYDILSALLCCSNIRFYKNTLSYFQNEQKSILLNYWSLSLEEQFYILLPLCLHTFNSLIFFILSLFSFIYCVIATYNNDSSSYYLLYSRAWELLLGLFTFKSQLEVVKINAKVILCLIIISSYTIGIYSFLKFPGFIAIIPTSLTSLLLLQDKNFIFKSKILEIIGNMSYIIYLFHYPIIQNNKSLVYIFLKISFISYFIYYLVEVPIKQSKKIIDFSVLGVIFSLIFIQRIYKSINNNRNYYTQLLENSNCKMELKCPISLIHNFDDYSVLLIGDSHLSQYLPVILSIIDKYKVGNIIFIQVWIINIEKNLFSISKLILDMKEFLLCIISLYVDYKFLYVEKNSFEKSFIYLVKKILSVSRGIIIFQDNPHRVRKNDTFCKKYSLPKVESQKIVYIDIFTEYCKGKGDCIKNIYSKNIFRDFHHINGVFVCKNKLVYDIIGSAINRFLVNKNKNNSFCNRLDLMYDDKYNKQITQNYGIRTIKKKLKGDGFGFEELPTFK